LERQAPNGKGMRHRSGLKYSTTHTPKKIRRKRANNDKSSK
jgi:hypothetical protein